MTRRTCLSLTVTALVVASVVPASAEAHGLVGRADLPIPVWLFAWAAGVVLVISFVLLSALWDAPRLEDDAWRPMPDAVSRVVTSRVVEVVAGALGVGVLVAVVVAGLVGTAEPTFNLAPTVVYVAFWLGLVPVSLLVGDVFRALNPWRAIGRASSWVADRVAGDRREDPLPYPERLGHYPAALGLLAFATLELVVYRGSEPAVLALAVLVYTVLTCGGMVLYGVDAWIDRGEAFSVYFGLLSRAAPVARRGRRLGLRPPLVGLGEIRALPGTVTLLAVMIGATTFDGLGELRPWRRVVEEVQAGLGSLGVGDAVAFQLVSGVGLVVVVALTSALYRLGIAGARALAGGGPELAGRFVHSLVPIALAYVGAHYVTFLLFQGQALVPLVSDPLGRGDDLFGTADRAIDYTLIGATTTWYLQVGLILAGHVAALALAHDRALVVYRRGGLATRSQLPMLAVMVAFTCLALWLLTQAGG